MKTRIACTTLVGLMLASQALAGDTSVVLAPSTMSAGGGERAMEGPEVAPAAER